MSLVTWNGKLLLSPGGNLVLGPAADECCCVAEPDNCQCYGPPVVGETMYATVTATDCGGCPVDWTMAWGTLVQKWTYNNFLCSGDSSLYFVIELDCREDGCTPPARSYWLYMDITESSPPPAFNSTAEVQCTIVSGPPTLLLEATITISVPTSLCASGSMTFTVQISDSP